MKIVNKTLLTIGILVLIAINLFTVCNTKNGEISLDIVTNLAFAQSETGADANVYYKSNPYSESGTLIDQFGVKWCWTDVGDHCNLKGNYCPNGITSTQTLKKC